MLAGRSHYADTPGEDIVCVLYDVFDFIEGASGGNVLVHCSQVGPRSLCVSASCRGCVLPPACACAQQAGLSVQVFNPFPLQCWQGVSRSTALAIAYLMWKWGRSYDDVFTRVKEHRGVANPNIGFICQVRRHYFCRRRCF